MEPYSGEYMFERCSSLAIEAGPLAYNLGDAVQIRFTCLPVYDGRGTLTVQFLPQAQSATYEAIVVDAPEVVPAAGYHYSAPVEFHRGVRFEATWTIRVQTATLHHVFASASFASVCAEEDACYPIDSPQAREQFGALASRPAANYPAFVLPAPQP
jgi:hypothetical protein